MKKILVFLTTMSIFVFACKTTKTAAKANNTSQMPTLAWSVVKAGNMGSSETARNIVIKSATEWQKEWAETNKRFDPAPAAPAVDFGQNWVIGCHIGTRSNGGYSASIKTVQQLKDEIVVSIAENAPGKNCMNSEVITHPFVYIKVPHFTETKVSYKMEKVVKDCN